MIEVQVTAHDKAGAMLAFSLGVSRSLDGAKAAAGVGMRARIAADAKLAASVRTFTVERI